MIEVVARKDLMLLQFDDVGDSSRYYVAVGTWPVGNDVYVALGGRYAPYTGGFFPIGTLVQFDELVIEWSIGAMNPDFFKALTDSGPRSGFYWYMASKQRISDVNKVPKWDLTVAFIIAWLYWKHPSLVQYEKVLKIIGTLYHNQQEETRNILTEIQQALDVKEQIG